jgi:hypothetical protein
MAGTSPAMTTWWVITKRTIIDALDYSVLMLASLMIFA